VPVSNGYAAVVLFVYGLVWMLDLTAVLPYDWLWDLFTELAQERVSRSMGLSTLQLQMWLASAWLDTVTEAVKALVTGNEMKENQKS
jgi:hypothetical protein